MQKNFSQIIMTRLLLLQFCFWAVSGQGLHFCGNFSYFEPTNAHVCSDFQHSEHEHDNSYSATHDDEHCSICSFYQSLQHTAFAHESLLSESVFHEQQALPAIGLPFAIVLAGHFLRGPPSIV